MNDRYILTALLGTQDAQTGKFKYIPLLAKAGDLTDLPSFNKKDIADIPETPDENYLPAGIIGIFDPATNTTKPIQLYADTREWIGISKTVSQHLTGGAEEQEAQK